MSSRSVSTSVVSDDDINEPLLEILRLGESGGGVLMFDWVSMLLCGDPGLRIRLLGSGKERVAVGLCFWAVGAGIAGRGVLFARRCDELLLLLLLLW